MQTELKKREARLSKDKTHTFQPTLMRDSKVRWCKVVVDSATSTVRSSVVLFIRKHFCISSEELVRSDAV